MHRVVLGARIVLGAYRVVRAQPGLIERREQMLADAPAGLDKTAKRALRT